MPLPTDPRIAAYLNKNKEWASSPDYVEPITFEQLQKNGRAREDGTVIIIACTDPRVCPEDFLGMSEAEGNRTTIVRSAGGRVHSILSTLLVLSAVGNGGKKGTIMIIHHTDCGLSTATDEQFRRLLMQNRELPPPTHIDSAVDEEDLPALGEQYQRGHKKRRSSTVEQLKGMKADGAKAKALSDLNGIRFGSIAKGKEEASVKEDVEYLRNSGWFNGTQIWGGLMDTKTGIIKEIHVPLKKTGFMGEEEDDVV